MPSLFSFKGGVHPLRRDHHKKLLTAHRAIEPCGVPDEIVLPLSQHCGSPSTPVVRVGDRVDLGQVVAGAGGYVSVPVSASVSGAVKAIEPRAHTTGRPCMSIVISNDFEDRLHPGIKSPGSLENLSPCEIVDIVKNAGIVGLGGAAFPTHVKLSPPADKKIDTVIVNGAECEPYLTADHRIMLEHPEEVIFGLSAVMKALCAQKAYIGVENNKRDAIDALAKAAKDKPVSIAALKVKYPQGSEKQLIDALLHRQVPSCGLPLDVGVVVFNASTIYQISLAVRQGLPLYERVVTVSGSVARPSNLRVRLGTPISHVIAHVGGFTGSIEKVIEGGPMMGVTQYTLDAPVVKGTTGLLALDKRTAPSACDSPCIRCGRCVYVCPVGLAPYLLSDYAQHSRFDDAKAANALDCIECGCCSYICPANRYLVQGIRLAKEQILNLRRKAQG